MQQQIAKNRVATADALQVTAQTESDQATQVDREEAIRQMAYAFYEARGRVDGYDLEDWLMAEVHLAQEEPA